MASTKKHFICPIVGSPKELSESVLPTSLDVLKYCSFLKSKNSSLNPNCILDTVLEKVVDKLQEIWKSACISTVSPQRIKYLIRKLNNDRRDLMKSYRLLKQPEKKMVEQPKKKKQKRKISYKEKFNDFKSRIEKLFDISLCKCRITEKCYCKNDIKRTVSTRDFLEDQRTTRVLTIPLKTSIELNVEPIIACPKPARRRVLKRKLKDLNSAEKVPSKKRKKYNTTKITSLALTSDRYGVSPTVTAAIASSTLHDYGIINFDANITDQIIDTNKVRRAKDKLRNALNKNVGCSIRGLFFDGRKDQTLSMEDNRKKNISESHYALLEAPGYKYVGHTAPYSGSAPDILQSFLDFFDTKKISLKDLTIIGGDGTVVNTGWIGGIISLLEKHLKRPLQWMICQLHANELPLRHLIEVLDGVTDGPEAFSGEIGKSLKKCTEFSIVSFKSIDCELPPISKKDLSTDQRYLFDMCNAISLGNCSESLSKRDPGRMCHSRWLTTGNRILRKYVSTENPTENLITLTTFILKVYAPLWFTIKKKQSCIYGAKHVYKQIELVRNLPSKLHSIIKPIVQDVIQRNAYFGHPENVLLAMLGDENRSVRELAVSRILEHRSKKKTNKIRDFKIPPLRFDATSYLDMIDWRHISSEPPVTLNMSEQDLVAIIEYPDNFIRDMKGIFCHTQPVERAVKMVTEACKISTDVSKRDGAIRAKILSRTLMPKFVKKSQFNVDLASF